MNALNLSSGIELLHPECDEVRQAAAMLRKQHGEIQQLKDRLEAAGKSLAEPAAEPVCHQYQLRDGTWHPFLNEKHYTDTAADGSWPIRALYASPPPPAEVPAAWLSEDEIGRIFLKFEGSLQSLRDCASEIEKAYRRKAGL